MLHTTRSGLRSGLFNFLPLFMVAAIASSVSLFSIFCFFSKTGDIWVPSNPLGAYFNESTAFSRLNLLHHTTEKEDEQADYVKEPEAWDSSRYILGDPTERFRDNLRNDTFHITTWSNAGFTNQFIGYVNLIYLAMISERVPIIAPFAPDHHISREAGIIPFGEIYNLTHLRKTLRTAILEWRDVKSLPDSSSPDPYSTSTIEELGCWSTRAEAEANPIRAESVVEHLGLDVSYTRVPRFTRRNPSYAQEGQIVFAQLAAAVHPRGPVAPPQSYPLMAPSPFGARAPPEERVSCFDVLYYMTSGAEIYEWRFPWSPAWRFVGRHVRFNEYLVERATGYVRRAFGLDDQEELPEFISIHVRHGDFAGQCDSPGFCLVSLARFVSAVEDMRQTLLAKKNLAVSRVLVSSDETDPLFWVEITSMGWNYIDHKKERTLEKFGEWHPPLVDVVAQSLAAGFVGTYDSTFSLVSGRRVQDWNDGYYTMVTHGQG